MNMPFLAKDLAFGPQHMAFERTPSALRPHVWVDHRLAYERCRANTRGFNAASCSRIDVLARLSDVSTTHRHWEQVVSKCRGSAGVRSSSNASTDLNQTSPSLLGGKAFEIAWTPIDGPAILL